MMISKVLKNKLFVNELLFYYFMKNKSLDSWIFIITSLLLVITFGGIFLTSERLMNVENDAKAYFIEISILLLLIPCFASSKGYSQLKKSLCSHNLYIGISAACLSLSLYGILQYVGTIPSRHVAFTITGTYENPAGFAAAQAAMFPYVYSLCLDKRRSGVIRCIAFVTSIACILTVVLSGSRAGVLAICAATAVLTAFGTEMMTFFKTHRWMWIPLFFVLIVLSLLMYLAKAESANGRLFIWNRCLELISNRPWFGYGTNGFNKCYMDVQAAYFNAHPDSSYVMLADNIIHPFNEFILLTVNYGFIGLFVAITLLVYIIVRLFRSDNRIRATGISVVVSVFVMSQFSYPFHYAAVWYIVALAVLPAFICHNSDKEVFKPIYVHVTLTFLLSLQLVVILRMAYLDMKWAEMSKRSLAGNTERMLPYYEEMKSKMKHNALFLYNYAAELNYIGRYEESLLITKECKNGWNDYDVQILLANNLENTGQIDYAIDAYRKASDMIPCRFEPLESMMMLYQNKGDTLNAVKIARRITSKPTKVQSSRVQQIKTEAQEILRINERFVITRM